MPRLTFARSICRRISTSALVLACVGAFVGLSAVRAGEKKKPITVEEVNAAQQAWCDGLVKIGKAKTDGGDYKAVAKKVIEDLYDYDGGTVFFRPTLAAGKNAFRNTKEGALSYFVGGNANFPEDKGFALKPWVKVRFDNVGEGAAGVQIHGDIAMTMGNVYLTSKSGKEIMVDKFFVFRRCADGRLRLIGHKSALPNDPPE